MSVNAIESKAASVEFNNVTKVYGTDVTAVDNVSLKVEKGELVTLLGPSGCGKTTTLRMIAGLEMATSGSIHIGDTDVTLLPATDRDVSMVFQSYALFPHMNVFENVSYGLRVSKLSKQELSEKTNNGLELVGLAGYGDRLPSDTPTSAGRNSRPANKARLNCGLCYARSGRSTGSFRSNHRYEKRRHRAKRSATRSL